MDLAHFAHLAHLANLVQARSAIAALADRAGTVEASSGYERVLIGLDRIQADECPAIHPLANLTSDSMSRLALAEQASSAVGALEAHGVDPLDLELLLAALDDARVLDGF